MIVIQTECYESTFGQTGAGCHSATTPEKILFACSVDGTEEEKEAFIRKADAWEFSRKAPKPPWGVDPKRIISFTRLVKVLQNLDPEAYAGSKFGPWNVRLVRDDYVPGGGSTTLDGENLSYQKALLSGRA